MNIETTLPYSWLRALSPDIKMVDEIPLWGSSPPFPWDQYGKVLGQILDVPLLKIEPSTVEWRLPEELLTPIGQEAVLYPLAVSPLEGYAYLLFSKENLKNLFEAVTRDKIGEESLKEWTTDWQEEFYQFLVLQAIHAFQTVGYDPSLSLQLLSDISLPKTPCLCIDLNIHTEQKTVFGRLIISPELRRALKQKYTPTTRTFPQGVSESVIATLHVVIGQTSLSKKEWREAKPGDFLMLDSCTMVPGEEKGRVVLTVNDTPIFRAKLKDNALKLLEYPLLQEVKTAMAREHDEEFDDTFESEDETLSDQEIDPFEGEDGEEEEEEADDEEESLGTSEEDLEEEDMEEEKPTGLAGKELLEKKQAPAPLVKPEDIPLTISVEIARIQMSMEQLQGLTPGNLLDLNITPEHGVDLVSNGHCIARGELLKLGETLGVRILDKA